MATSADELREQVRPATPRPRLRRQRADVGAKGRRLLRERRRLRR